MGKLLRGVLAIVLLAGLYVALVLSEWLPRPTAEEQAALAALEPQPASVSGDRDGFAASWLMSYEVPEDQLASVMAADIAAYQVALKNGTVGAFKSTAEGKFAAVATPNGRETALCEAWADSCLARVQANPEATRTSIASFASRLERSRWLGKYDHFPYPFVPRFDSPLGGMGGLINLQLADAALKFVDGDAAAGFQALCADTASWRRLRAHSDMLIYDMIGVAQMANAIKLYAEMLKASPLEMAPPCPEVFAPLRDEEMDQCAVMRFEFLSTRNSFDSETALPETASAMSAVMRPLINDTHVIRRSSLITGPYCQAVHRQRIAQRDPVIPPVSNDCSAVESFFDPIGCPLLHAFGPALQDYYWRVLDLDARLRLLANAVALRGVDASQVGAQFAKRPAALESARHAFEWDAAAQVLRMRNLEDNRGEYYELPVRIASPLPAQP